MAEAVKVAPADRRLRVALVADKVALVVLLRRAASVVARAARLLLVASVAARVANAGRVGRR